MISSLDEFVNESAYWFVLFGKDRRINRDNTDPDRPVLPDVMNRLKF